MVKVKILIFIVGIIMIGCYPQFTNPLSEPLESKVDERLLGTWYSKDWYSEDKKEIIYLHVEKGLDNLTKITFEGADKNGVGKDEDLIYTMFPTKIKNDFYMNLQDDSLRENHTYMIAKYLVNDKDELFIWELNNHQLIKDVENHKLAGQTSKKSFSSARITDSPFALTHYLSSTDHKLIFSLLAKFHRISPSH